MNKILEAFLSGEIIFDIYNEDYIQIKKSPNSGIFTVPNCFKSNDENFCKQEILTSEDFGDIILNMLDNSLDYKIKE